MPQILRRPTRQVRIGNVLVGGDAPVVVQSMTNTDTADIAASEETISAASVGGGGNHNNSRLLLREENVKQLELTSLGQVKRSKARRLLLLNDSVSNICIG